MQNDFDKKYFIGIFIRNTFLKFMHSIETLISMAESAARDGVPSFDWQRERTMENPYAKRNFRGTDWDDNNSIPRFHQENTTPKEDINKVFFSELEGVLIEWEKVWKENDRRKNQKIARKTVWKVKEILRNTRYLSYRPEAFAQTMWGTHEGIVFQKRNPELPQLIYNHQSFELIKQIQDRLSEHLSYKDQEYIQSLPNSIWS